MPSKLLEFLENRMSMSAVYQPLIIRELLLNDGICSVSHLARKLAESDASTLAFYKSKVMRWPKQILRKHSIIEYDSKHKSFFLIPKPSSAEEKQKALLICERKIHEWLLNQKEEGAPSANPSLRYKILKKANGRCELCGISSQISPIDIDHIVPKSKAKNGKVRKDDKLIPVNTEENLQALCSSCNRGKRDTDQTDFRKQKKLVRDNIPDFIRAEGRSPKIRKLSGKDLLKALDDKLLEEHAEYLQGNKIEELADLVEVAFAIAEARGFSKEDLMSQVRSKREKVGGFKEGYFYEGDE